MFDQFRSLTDAVETLQKHEFALSEIGILSSEDLLKQFRSISEGQLVPKPALARLITCQKTLDCHLVIAGSSVDFIEALASSAAHSNVTDGNSSNCLFSTFYSQIKDGCIVLLVNAGKPGHCVKSAKIIQQFTAQNFQTLEFAVS